MNEAFFSNVINHYCKARGFPEPHADQLKDIITMIHRSYQRIYSHVVDSAVYRSVVTSNQNTKMDQVKSIDLHYQSFSTANSIITDAILSDIDKKDKRRYAIECLQLVVDFSLHIICGYESLPYDHKSISLCNILYGSSAIKSWTSLYPSLKIIKDTPLDSIIPFDLYDSNQEVFSRIQNGSQILKQLTGLLTCVNLPVIPDREYIALLTGNHSLDEFKSLDEIKTQIEHNPHNMSRLLESYNAHTADAIYTSFNNGFLSNVNFFDESNKEAIINTFSSLQKLVEKDFRTTEVIARIFTYKQSMMKDIIRQIQGPEDQEALDTYFYPWGKIMHKTLDADKGTTYRYTSLHAYLKEYIEREINRIKEIQDDSELESDLYQLYVKVLTIVRYFLKAYVLHPKVIIDASYQKIAVEHLMEDPEHTANEANEIAYSAFLEKDYLAITEPSKRPNMMSNVKGSIFNRKKQMANIKGDDDHFIMIEHPIDIGYYSFGHIKRDSSGVLSLDTSLFPDIQTNDEIRKAVFDIIHQDSKLKQYQIDDSIFYNLNYSRENEYQIRDITDFEQANIRQIYMKLSKSQDEEDIKHSYQIYKKTNPIYPTYGNVHFIPQYVDGIYMDCSHTTLLNPYNFFGNDVIRSLNIDIERYIRASEYVVKRLNHLSNQVSNKAPVELIGGNRKGMGKEGSIDTYTPFFNALMFGALRRLDTSDWMSEVNANHVIQKEDIVGLGLTAEQFIKSLKNKAYKSLKDNIIQTVNPDTITITQNSF